MMCDCLNPYKIYLFNYSSRRAYIENQVVTWLNNTNIVWQNAPDELDGLSEELRTLLNIDGKVYIGGQIYNYIPSDESVEITVNNLQVASSLMATGQVLSLPTKSRILSLWNKS